MAIVDSVVEQRQYEQSLVRYRPEGRDPCLPLPPTPVACVLNETFVRPNVRTSYNPAIAVVSDTFNNGFANLTFSSSLRS